MKAEKLDELFDAGEDITPHLDLSTKDRPGHKHIRFYIDFPEWMTDCIDRQADMIGVTRQTLIRSWIAERLGVISSE
ncbi:MAG: hypothetical protein V2I97_22195 [Desulfococcaceae bacterium]|jgi:hypothetical protein|nr:hypothetical protein [Desulfococcaceae bacterium]